MSTSHFHPLVQTWFAQRFHQPTAAQALGWPAIAQGKHTLIAAPTGSGKTLAAFLNCLDSLVRQGLENGVLPDATQVVYVSPLKALSNDIHRNLVQPLEEIKALAQELGTPFPEIRVAVRTGDTTAKERALHAKQPPHVLITTPESLFILLTSERGRRALTSVRTLILDELHAVVANKRGSHLSLSVERLCYLADGPVTRIGLSATQRPIEQVACFLTGAGRNDPTRPSTGPGRAEIAPILGESVGPGTSLHDCTVVDTGHWRAMDLCIELPEGEELGPIATHELWAKVLDQITAHIWSHHTTLVFVNTRRLVERVTHLLEARLGEGQVVAHHGSLSRETRFDAEQRLKDGGVKACVATASLELGIDVGDIDLAIQIGSPRSIGVALQRVGRSGHSLGATPKGLFYPLTRDELIETVALFQAVDAGALDALTIPPWPLDILAQQVVAACVNEEWEEDRLFDLCRRAFPYHELPRGRFDQVVAILSEGVSTRWGRGTAYLHRDGVHRRLKARRGARIASVTSGGAIPDTADYTVIAEPEGTVVGAVNEDFAIESMAGDIFLLGNTPWRIRRVEANTIRVEEAQGQSPTIPFWLGEAPGRTTELSEAVSFLRQEIDERLAPPATAVAWVMRIGVGRDVAEQVVEYVAEGKRVLGVVPTATHIVAERFFDETGGMQLVIHSPMGSRINRAWGFALRKRICRTFNVELQASATDDGINLALGPQHSFLVEDVFSYLKSATVTHVLTQALLAAPLFTTRWRWTATRSLTLLRQVGGKRVPTAIQRMRSDDLLAAVFPAQVACQDNMPAGEDIELPDHPLVFEAMRDCLTLALDVEGLTEVIRRVEAGQIEVYGRDTLQPSVFSHQILNAMPYAFLDDAPLEERRARAVSLRRALPQDARDLTALDPEAIHQEEEHAWPVVRDADELHDAMLTLGVLTEADLMVHSQDAADWLGWFEALVADGRALRMAFDDGRQFWLTSEQASLVRIAYPLGRLVPPQILATSVVEMEDAVLALVRGRVECSGPFTCPGLARDLVLPLAAVAQAVAALENDGLVLRGRFRPASAGAHGSEEEFCDRRILARIHRSTIGRLRRESEPVPAASYIRFLLEWQHLTPASRVSGEEGLLEVIEQLQGYEAAAVAWESAILPARVTGFTPSLLDALCFSGDVAWGRFTRRMGSRAGNGRASAGLSRNGPISLGLRGDLPWLLDRFPQDGDGREVSGAAEEVLHYLKANGASFLPDIVAAVRQLPAEVESCLRQLVAAGEITADGFGALRGLISGVARRTQRISRYHLRPKVRLHSSRWVLLRTAKRPDDYADARAGQFLRRYGVVVPELMARESMALPWRALLRVYRRAEARGEVRGGRFVAGFVGEQFALPEAVGALRSVHKRPVSNEEVRLSSCDPLNVVGILTPGARVPAALGTQVMYRDGAPVGITAFEGAQVAQHTAPLP